MRPNPSLERDLHRPGTWPARRFRSSSTSRAKRHPGSGPSAQTLGRMKQPLCPACRERMSSVEAGLVGVWTCVYCEGAWLRASRTSSVAAHLVAQAEPLGSEVSRSEDPSLLCPSCGGEHFTRLGSNQRVVYQCNQCGSGFIPKQTVVANVGALGGRNWDLANVLAQALTSKPSIAVDGTLGVTALLLWLVS